MTKKHLANLIIEIVLHNVDEPHVDQQTNVCLILDALTPKDLELFSKWGNDDEKSTPEKCWTKTKTN